MTSNQLKRNGKDTVFTTFFNIKENAYQAFLALHKDSTLTIDDIEVITLDPLITNGIYNDLGILAGNRFMIFVEEQSNWSYNIGMKCLMYYMHSLEEYISKNNISLHIATKVELPIPEFYCIYAGNKNVKDTFSLKEDYFQHELCGIDMKVHIIRQTNENEYGIFKEYLQYTRIFNEAIKMFGYTKQAAVYIIETCINENCLKEFMEKHRLEVQDMIMNILSQEWAEHCRKLEEEKKQKEFEMRQQEFEMLQKENEMHIQALENQLVEVKKESIEAKRMSAEYERKTVEAERKSIEYEKKIQETLDEEEQMKMNFAKKMKQKGFSIEEIIEVTQLSIEKVNQC